MEDPFRSLLLLKVRAFDFFVYRVHLYPPYLPFLEKDTLGGAPKGFVHQVSALHQQIDVYSYRYITLVLHQILQKLLIIFSRLWCSYLGLGLMAARKQILSVGHPETELTLRSPCINPMVKKGWNYSGVNYIVT